MTDSRSTPPAEAPIGSWAEARRFAARQARQATPQRRFAWLEEMLAIAESSGALARARAARDRDEAERRSGVLK
jgi:hypothetical protein